MPSLSTVILGTGGTIAGAAPRADQSLHYQAGALSVDDLLAAVPPLQGLPLESERVAQLDSSDMDHATWQALAQRCAVHLARPEVGGLVITHGTDTLEETAYFLQRVLAPSKPVVLTAAMRPATALSADGPRNLLDAVRVARWPQARGVVVAFGGAVYAADALRKVHGARVDAFAAGDAGPLAWLHDDTVQALRAWPDRAAAAGASAALTRPVSAWPAVDLLWSHAGADGRLLDAAVAAGSRGVVIAGTGNGTVHRALRDAAARAQAAGVAVWRASRCTLGGIVGAEADDALPAVEALSPAQARVELLLQLLAKAD